MYRLWLMEVNPMKIFAEFSKDWTGLSYQAQIIRAKMLNQEVSEIIDFGDINYIPAGEYREQMMKARVGQYFFRMAVLNVYGSRCCITGVKPFECIASCYFYVIII